MSGRFISCLHLFSLGSFLAMCDQEAICAMSIDFLLYSSNRPPGLECLLITHEHRHKHARRASSSDNRRDRDHSPGGLRGAITGFLNPHGGEERRSRSHGGERRRRKSRGGSVSEEEDIVIRRGGDRWR